MQDHETSRSDRLLPVGTQDLQLERAEIEGAAGIRPGCDRVPPNCRVGGYREHDQQRRFQNPAPGQWQNCRSGTPMDFRCELGRSRSAPESRVCGSMVRNQGRQNFGDFKHRTVVEGCYAGADAEELLAIQHRRNRKGYLPEGRQHYSKPILRDPIGIRALLHHRPGVALDYHRETHNKRFADATRTRLADEKISQLHEVRNFWGEAYTMKGIRQLHAFEMLAQLVIVTAYENKLGLQPRGFDSSSDSCHLAGAVAAKHHNARRQFGVEPQPDSLGVAAELHRGIEPRQHNLSWVTNLARGTIPQTY